MSEVSTWYEVTKGYRSYTKHLGCVIQPLFDIPSDRIVLDELHLLLRIGDVLHRYRNQGGSGGWCPPLFLLENLYYLPCIIAETPPVTLLW